MCRKCGTILTPLEKVIWWAAMCLAVSQVSCVVHIYVTLRFGSVANFLCCPVRKNIG